jgi:hypothetical protein
MIIIIIYYYSSNLLNCFTMAVKLIAGEYCRRQNSCTYNEKMQTHPEGYQV